MACKNPFGLVAARDPVETLLIRKFLHHAFRNYILIVRSKSMSLVSDDLTSVTNGVFSKPDSSPGRTIMLETITHLVTNYGYIVVAFFILFECAGFPLPGETALLVAAGFAGAGKLSIAIVIIIAAAAAILGDAGGYWIGRLLGRGFVVHWGKYVGLSESKMQTLEGFFVKHGSLTVFFGRFVGVLRTYSALFAGISKMPYLTFTIFNALGGIVWAVVFGTIGFLFGQNVDEIENLARIFGWGALLGVVLIAATWYLRRWAKSTVRDAVHESGLRGIAMRVLSGAALVATSGGRARLSRTSVVMLYAVGLGITVLVILFVSGATHSLAEYDPLVRFEEVMSSMIDNWLTQSQSRLFLYIAKFGSVCTLIIGVCTSLVSMLLTRRLYMFTMMFGILGGEALNALLAFLNRGYGAFVSSHFFVRLGYLFAYDNMIVPVIVFGMLAYFTALSMKQINLVITVIIGFTVPALAVVAASFLSGLHGGIEFFEELLCAIIWLWICIGLMQFIRLKQHQHEIQRQIASEQK
jgi:membrane protein DedA with SNARE-associated domain